MLGSEKVGKFLGSYLIGVEEALHMRLFIGKVPQ